MLVGASGRAARFELGAIYLRRSLRACKARKWVWWELCEGGVADMDVEDVASRVDDVREKRWSDSNSLQSK